MIGLYLCPFRRITGVACPFCGLSRAMVSLVTGHLDRAIRLQPLAPLVAAVLVFCATRYAARTLSALNGGASASRASRSARSAPLDATEARVLAVVGVLLSIVWVVRAATGSLPPV